MRKVKFGILTAAIALLARRVARGPRPRVIAEVHGNWRHAPRGFVRLPGAELHALGHEQVRGEGAGGGNRCHEDGELNGLHGAQGTPTRRFAVRFAA